MATGAAERGPVYPFARHRILSVGQPESELTPRPTASNPSRS